MKIQIEKDLKDCIDWKLLFEDEKGELFEGVVKEVRESAVKIDTNTEGMTYNNKWLKTEELKVVDILN